MQISTELLECRSVEIHAALSRKVIWGAAGNMWWVYHATLWPNLFIVCDWSAPVYSRLSIFTGSVCLTLLKWEKLCLWCITVGVVVFCTVRAGFGGWQWIWVKAVKTKACRVSEVMWGEGMAATFFSVFISFMHSCLFLSTSRCTFCSFL